MYYVYYVYYYGHGRKSHLLVTPSMETVDHNNDNNDNNR